MPITESLNVIGANLIVFLQDNLTSWAQFFMNVSVVGDPALAFTFYLPLTVSFSFQAGFALLWTLLICEWSNMILKWVLAGDRPFWWIHESPYYIHKSLPHVRQTPLTCETGPGMPSGHSTLNAALFFILIKYFLNHFGPQLRRFVSERYFLWVKRFIWTIYGLWILLVVTSRIFIAAHFPHQCIAGVIIGLAIAQLVLKFSHLLTIKTKKEAIFLSLFLLGSVFGVFGIYKILGNDPMWSVSKAIRWCAKREYIHIDSKPFYALSRFSGLALGLGLALASSLRHKISNIKFTTKMKISNVILAFSSGQAAHFIHRLLPSTIFGYYVLEFTLNAFYAYLLLALLPSFVASASGAKPKPQTKLMKDKKK